MKKLITIIAALAVFVGISNAQTYAPNQVANIPTSLTAATNLATPVVLDFRRQQNAAISVTMTSTSAGQTNTYTFCRSIDGSTYDTNAVITLAAITANGTARTTVISTNIGGVGYLVLTRIAPTGTDSATNVVKFSTKTQSP